LVSNLSEGQSHEHSLGKRREIERKKVGAGNKDLLPRIANECVEVPTKCNIYQRTSTGEQQTRQTKSSRALRL
jgi:hypothetical protein